MDLSEYQRRAQQTAIYPYLGHNLVYPTLGLVGEAGEVAEKVKKLLRDEAYEVGMPTDISDAFVDIIAMELGDVLWYVAALCSELGITMTQLAQINLAKLQSRQRRNALQGSGDDR